MFMNATDLYKCNNILLFLVLQLSFEPVWDADRCGETKNPQNGQIIMGSYFM